MNPLKLETVSDNIIGVFNCSMIYGSEIYWQPLASMTSKWYLPSHALNNWNGFAVFVNGPTVKIPEPGAVSPNHSIDV